MYNKAVDKLKNEMEINNNNSYIQVVGGFLLKQLSLNPDIAEKILKKNKTISKSLNEMRKAAEKNKIGNCAVLTDQEGFEIVLKYFDIEASKVSEVMEEKYIEKPELDKKKSKVHFDVKLEDYL